MFEASSYTTLVPTFTLMGSFTQRASALAALTKLLLLVGYEQKSLLDEYAKAQIKEACQAEEAEETEEVNEADEIKKAAETVFSGAYSKMLYDMPKRLISTGELLTRISEQANGSDRQKEDVNLQQLMAGAWKSINCTHTVEIVFAQGDYTASLFENNMLDVAFRNIFLWMIARIEDSYSEEKGEFRIHCQQEGDYKKVYIKDSLHRIPKRCWQGFFMAFSFYAAPYPILGDAEQEKECYSPLYIADMICAKNGIMLSLTDELDEKKERSYKQPTGNVLVVQFYYPQ